VEQHLSGDPVEVMGAPDDVEPTVVSFEVAFDTDVAESADLTVEVNEGVAPRCLCLRIEGAYTSRATDAVVAVLRIEELVPEPVRGSVLARRDRLCKHAEVMIERCGGRDREQAHAENRKSPGHDELAHKSPLRVER